jgi:hypothetical protein
MDSCDFIRLVTIAVSLSHLDLARRLVSLARTRNAMALLVRMGSGNGRGGNPLAPSSPPFFLALDGLSS